MADYARLLCNELMGLDRNKTTHEEKTKEKRFFDKDVRYILNSLILGVQIFFSFILSS